MLIDTGINSIYMFSDFLKLGTEHILDPNGYDHILFIATLCALYLPEEWKKLFILVTAFTLGHTLTLALSSLNVLQINPALVELLIPVTIMLTGVFNMYTIQKSRYKSQNLIWHYSMALIFGLIHGLGFSNYFKALMGNEESIVKPLFAFNLGVELGQLFIVIVVMSLAFIFINKFYIKRKYWTVTVSLLSILMSVYLLINK